MLALASMALSWGMGWAVIRWILWRARFNTVFALSLGWAAGTAISSFCFFLLRWAGAPAYLAPLIELAILSGCLLRRRPAPAGDATVSSAGGPWTWVLRPAVAVALGMFLLGAAPAIRCQPDGGWDALFIWNIRAKFLAAGDQNWRAAIEHRVKGLPTPVAHADYPLLTSAFLGRAWWFGDASDASIPAAAGLIYSLALVGLLGSSLAWLSSEAAGLVAMLALLSCDLFLAWSTAQYADIPLALFGLGSLALLAAAPTHAWPPEFLLLSGLLGGAACWTKNEGIPLLICLLATGLWFAGPRAAVWMAAGAAPLAAVTAAFKLFLAPASSTAMPASVGEAAARFIDPGRWGLILKSFAVNFAGLSPWWAHPMLLLGAAAYTLGWVASAERRLRWRLAAAPVGLLAADAAFLLTTGAELAWNLETAADRLLLQALPGLIFVFAAALQAPAAPSKAPSKPSGRRKR